VPPNAPSRTRHRLDPLAPLIARVALGAVMLPHRAQGSWEGLAIYLAKELRDTRIRVNAADPGYTATDFNVVPAGEATDFKRGAPAAGRGGPTTRAESLGRSLRLTRGLVVAQASLATRLSGHCPRNSSAPAAVDHPDERGIDGVTRQTGRPGGGRDASPSAPHGVGLGHRAHNLAQAGTAGTEADRDREHAGGATWPTPALPATAGSWGQPTGRDCPKGASKCRRSIESSAATVAALYVPRSCSIQRPA
jgi:hypothetical protein